MTVICLFVASCLVTSIYIKDHSTCYKYNDRFVIGKTAEEIEKRYGEADVKGKDYIGYNVVSSGIDSMPDKCYCIFFNDKNKAESVCMYGYGDMGVDFEEEPEAGYLYHMGEMIFWFIMAILALIFGI